MNACRRLQELLLRSEAIRLLDLTNCAALRHLVLPALQPSTAATATGALPPVCRNLDSNPQRCPLQYAVVTC